MPTPKKRWPYQRSITTEQTRWENFKAKCIDPQSDGKRWFTSGEGTEPKLNIPVLKGPDCLLVF